MPGSILAGLLAAPLLRTTARPDTSTAIQNDGAGQDTDAYAGEPRSLSWGALEVRPLKIESAETAPVFLPSAVRAGVARDGAQ